MRHGAGAAGVGAAVVVLQLTNLGLEAEHLGHHDAEVLPNPVLFLELEHGTDEGIDEFFWQMIGGSHCRLPSRWPVGGSTWPNG